MLGPSDRPLLGDWRGTIFAWFAVVWVANRFMSIHGRLQLGIKTQNVEIRVLEEQRANALRTQIEDDDIAL